MPLEHDIPGLIPTDAPALRPLQRYEQITYQFPAHPEFPAHPFPV